MHLKTAPKTIYLRPYQKELLDRVIKCPDDCVLESPTGSGKGTMIVALCRMLVRTGRYKRIVIATPQDHLVASFCNRSYSKISLLPEGQYGAGILVVGPTFIRNARAAGRSGENIQNYLSHPQEYVLVTTHSALAQLSISDLPEDMSDTVLIPDEVHHAGALGMETVSDAFRKRGARFIGPSATPFRTDGKPIVLPGMKHFRRSLAKHMEEGYAPKRLLPGIIHLGKEGDRVSTTAFFGDSAPVSLLEMCRSMVREWEKLHRPKLIVRVPPERGGSHRTVQELRRSFEEAGARVLDATGLGKGNQRRFQKALADEAQLKWHESKIDVIISVQRCLEGTDWQHCSAVFAYGFPRSLNMAAQLFGRALRPKPFGHPHIQDSKLYFFVDTAGGRAAEDVNLAHSRFALMLCCLIDHGGIIQHQQSETWAKAVLKANRILESQEQPPIEDDTDPTYVTPNEVHAQATVSLTAFQTANPDYTVKDCLWHLHEQKVPTSVASKVVIDVLLSTTPEAREKFEEELVTRLSNRRHGLVMHKEMRDAVDACPGAVPGGHLDETRDPGKLDPPSP